jgi:hypothetical protein
VTFPRLLGALVLVWSGWVAWTPADGSVPPWVWPLASLLWVVPGILLLRGRCVRSATVAVAALSAAGFVVGRGGDEFLLWIAVILLATEDHQRERALLLRTMVTVVYAFAALTKLNPVWLEGHQLVRIANRSDYMEPFLPLFTSPAGRWMAMAVVVTEAWLAIGLWLDRTRAVTALLGIVVHLALTVAAAETLEGLFNLVPLNFGLVAMYLAFWHPIAPELDRAQGHPTPLAGGFVRELALR